MWTAGCTIQFEVEFRIKRTADDLSRRPIVYSPDARRHPRGGGASLTASAHFNPKRPIRPLFCFRGGAGPRARVPAGLHARARWLTRECPPARIRVPACSHARVDFRVRQAFRNKCPFLTEVRGDCSSNPGTAFDDDAFSQIRSFVRALHGRFGTLTAARDGVFCAVRRQTGIFSAKGAGRGATEAACAAE